MTAPCDYGPRQLAEYLGAFYGQVDRARSFGLLPEPDRSGRRWSAAAAEQIRARWPEIAAAVECIGAPGLRKRGWTEAMIRDLLGDPDVLTDNPHYKSAAPRRLWLLRKVQAAEATPEFATRENAPPVSAPPRPRRQRPGSSGKRWEVPDELRTWRLRSAHPAIAAVCAAAALAAVFMLWRADPRLAASARTVLRGQQAEDLLTVAAAGLATAVAMTGMWRFFGTVLHFTGAERAAMFAFLELAVVTCAFRARRNMRAFGSAGTEGIAVWVLSGLSAVFSSLDARSAAEAVFRLAAPLVAAWLWERGLALERRRASGRVVHWRLTAERILVWLGVAEPSARAASDVDAHRRIARLARAAKRLRDRRASGAWGWRQQRARRGWIRPWRRPSSTRTWHLTRPGRTRCGTRSAR